jgi:hypothetical protein
MARRLYVVEAIFVIPRRGIALYPGIVPEEEERWQVGNTVLLKRPDGSSFLWQIAGLEMCYPPPPNHAVTVLLKGLGKEDVPIGTEVWSVDQS